MKKFISLFLILILITSTFPALAAIEPVDLIATNTTSFFTSAEPMYSVIAGGYDRNSSSVVYVPKENSSVGGWFAVELTKPSVITSIAVKTRPNNSLGEFAGFVFELANKRDFSDAVTVYTDTRSASELSYGQDIKYEHNDTETTYKYARIRRTGVTVICFAEFYLDGYIPPEKFMIEEITDGDTALTDDGIIPESADFVENDFTNIIDVDDLIEGNKVSANDGELPVEYIYDEMCGDKLVIAFKKALVRGDSLTIVLNNVYDMFGQSLSDTLTFEVGEGITGKSYIVSDKLIVSSDVVDIKGTVLSSKNVPISGRNVELYVTVPGGTEEFFAETVSDEDGRFEFEYTLPQNSPSGRFTFVIKCDYAREEEQLTYNYFSSDIEQMNLTSLSTTIPTSKIPAQYSTIEGGIDGDPNTCTYFYDTSRRLWYMVDFGKPCVITSVSLKNRPSGDTNINNIKIEVSNDSDFVDAVEIYRNETTEWTYNEGPEFTFDSGEEYRYLRVSKLTTGLFCFADLTVNGYIPPEEFKIEKITDGYTELADGDIIPESADFVELDFANSINISDLIEENKITAINNDEEFPVKYIHDASYGDKLILAFKKSLIKGDSLTITLNDVCDIFGQSISDILTFEIGEGITASTRIVADRLNADTGKVTISGTAFSSKNIAISGRVVKLYVTIPFGMEEYLGEVVSDENGRFDFEYNIPQDSVEGRFAFSLDGTYIVDRTQLYYSFFGFDKKEKNLTTLSTTTASSVTAPNYGSVVGAIDGKTDTYIYMSGSNKPAWLMVDFKIPCVITSVSLKNRQSGDTNINNIKIEVSNDPDFTNAVEIYRDETSTWSYEDGPEFTVSPDDKYRYLRVSKLSTGLLCFADLTVNGYLIPPMPDVTQIFIAENPIFEGSVISRGFGNFVLDFNVPMDISSVNSGSVYLLANGENIPLGYEIDDSRLTFKLKKPLSSGSVIKLVLNNIKDVFSQSFSKEYNFSVRPVDEEFAVPMLNSLKSSANIMDVKAILSEENCTTAGIVPIENRGVIEDYDKFYNHFVGKDYSSVDLFADAYEEFVVLEMINQAENTDDISVVINNELNCLVLNLPHERLTKVIFGKDDMQGEILNLASQTDADELSLHCNKIIDKYCLLEYKKATAVEVESSSQTIYDGQDAEINLVLKDEHTDISKIIFDITSTNASTLENADVNIVLDGTYTKTLTDGVLTIVVIPRHVIGAKVKRIGSVTLSVAKGTPGYSVTIAGNVEYAVRKKEVKEDLVNKNDGNKYTENVKEYVAYKDASNGKYYITHDVMNVISKINPAISNVSFTPQNVQSGNKVDTETSRPSGGFGGGGASYAPVVPTTPVIPDKPQIIGTFSDMSGSEWAVKAVNVLLEKGILSQSPDNRFYPERAVTREEFVKMLVTSLGLYNINASSYFADVSYDAWYASYVASAVNAGIISGRGDGTFGSGEPITREDMAVMLMRANKYSVESNKNTFADDSSISDYAKNAVYTLKSKGIINGVSDREFVPKSNATRAMAAKIIYEMLKEVE